MFSFLAAFGRVCLDCWGSRSGLVTGSYPVFLCLLSELIGILNFAYTRFGFRDCINTEPSAKY